MSVGRLVWRRGSTKPSAIRTAVDTKKKLTTARERAESTKTMGSLGTQGNRGGAQGSKSQERPVI